MHMLVAPWCFFRGRGKDKSFGRMIMVVCDDGFLFTSDTTTALSHPPSPSAEKVVEQSEYTTIWHRFLQVKLH